MVFLRDFPLPIQIYSAMVAHCTTIFFLVYGQKIESSGLLFWLVISIGFSWMKYLIKPD